MAKKEAQTAGSDRQREIEELYAAGATTSDHPEAFARLRELQQEEAAEAQRRFEASLPLPPGSGYALLARTRQLLKRLKTQK